MEKTTKPDKYLAIIFALYLGFCFLQRLIYAIWIFASAKVIPERIVLALTKGILFDLAAAFYLFLPLMALLLLVPAKRMRSRYIFPLFLCASFFPFFLVVFTAIGELGFFNEFNARFNFIAVDYLVYTHEVVRNVWESYPIVWAFFGMFLVFSPFVMWLSRMIKTFSYDGPWLTARRSVLLLFTAGLVPAMAVSEQKLLAHDSYWPRELGKNTLFAMFSAYHNNAISFEEFYTSVDSPTAERLTTQWLREPSIIRKVDSGTPPRKWNVVVVIIESFSARFMQTYGNKKPITPNMDRLAGEGLFFSNLYATGTRTVRGLEALMLSIPPTPGQSILRRPDSDGLFNLGTVFSGQGYRTQFIYGGYALFDNMKQWFSGNGFEVHDRGTFDSADVHFANAWGVCDEDLFDQVIKNADQMHTAREPFFQAVLTTSNHRPYTYPEGRIDIPSKSGREGAVKYTDYAIGRFLKMSEAKPWFKNTLFIFVADHNAAVAGGTDIPIADYLIPVIFYNPNLIQPQKMDTLASQIDFAPTLLGLLGFSYESKFYGQDLFKKQDQRAFLGTYQKVAYYTPGKMIVLAPGYTVETQTLDENGKILNTKTVKARHGHSLPPDAQETISLYQSAGELFNSGRAKAVSRIQ